MKKIFILIIFFISAFSVSFGASYGKLDKKVIALVNKAIEYYKENGREKAFEEFNKANGQFVDGNLYIFVIGFDGIMLSHGNNPALIGKSMLELKDSDGIYFTKEMIKTVKGKDAGWVIYKYTNPETKKVAKKYSYAKKIPGEEMFVGCGYYK